MLYRLDIECPDSMSVKRVLAWTLMGLGKYEQAEKEYNRLTADNDVENGDWLNAGYCQWLKGNTPEAINRFKNFMANRNIHSPKGNMKYPTNSPMTKISCTNMELTIPISTLWRISLTAPQNNGSRQRNGVSKWANHPTNFCHGVRHSSHISSVSLNECFLSRSNISSSSFVVQGSTITAFSS